MSALFHPGVTNCGGTLAASGCSCARTMTAEAPDVDLMTAAPVYSEDERSVRDWMPTASDETFSRLCAETATWVDDIAKNPRGIIDSEPDFHAIVRNSVVAVLLARNGARDLPKILLDEIRNRQVTDVEPGAEQRAKVYEDAARKFFASVPGIGSPTNANEAAGMWQGVKRGTRQDGRGFFHQIFTEKGQPGDPLSDPEAARYAVEDTECGLLAVDALRRGYRAGTAEGEQFTLRLASSPNHEVRAKIAEAVTWHDDLTPVMAADPDPRVRANIAGRMGAMEGDAHRDPRAQDRDLFQGHTLNDERYSQRRALIAISRDLARDPDTDVRRALAASASTWTDKKTQRILAEDPDPMVRNVLAAHARKIGLDEKAVKTLAKDSHPGVRENLLTSGADIPERYLKRLLKDPDQMVSAAAASRLRAPGGAPNLVVRNGRIEQGA